MKRSRRIPMIAFVVSLGASCAVGPKPEALRVFEHVRASRRFRAAQGAQRAEIRSALAAHRKAVDAWQDGEPALARHYATLALIRYRLADARLAQQRAARRSRRARERLRHAKAERRRLAEKMEDLDEKIELYEQLAMARVSTKVKEMELDEEQQKSRAQRRLIDAQLALKNGETVSAQRYASRTFNVAKELLSKAGDALRSGELKKATTLAELSKKKADAAYQEARLRYLKAKEAAARRARAEVLKADAEKIDGISVALSKAGDTRQLTLPLPRLFAGRSVRLRNTMLRTLNAIAALLKKYPTYPVVINGYTSAAVPKARRFDVSQARARAVAQYLLTLGLPLKRFAINGRGVENFIGRRFNPANNRVDIVLLFQ